MKKKNPERITTGLVNDDLKCKFNQEGTTILVPILKFCNVCDLNSQLAHILKIWRLKYGNTKKKKKGKLENS